jgi:hypothetical protein
MMDNDTLNETVERLFDDRRFLRRFRRNPERALRRSGLETHEIDALKRGETRELLALGMRPTLVWPELRPAMPSPAAWLFQSRRKLAPAALLLALAAVAPAQATAARRQSLRTRALERVVGRRAARRIGECEGRCVPRNHGRRVRLLARHAGAGIGGGRTTARLIRAAAQRTFEKP